MGAACAAVLAVLPFESASAEAPNGFAGTLSGAYGQSSCGGCGSIHNWGISGQGAFGLGTSDLGAEVDLGYQGSSLAGFDSHAFGFGGNIFWAPVQGRLGATVGYTTLDTNPDVNVWNYGVFGEYYIAPQITLGVAGGGLTASCCGSSESGTYIGGGGIGYIIPDLALIGTISSTHADNFGTATSYGIAAEWLVSETFPISVFAGFNSTDLPFSAPKLNSWLIGAKFYFGSGGATGGTTLADHHRNGALDPLVNTNMTNFQNLF
jgi:hypothetical protein